MIWCHENQENQRKDDPNQARIGERREKKGLKPSCLCLFMLSSFAQREFDSGAELQAHLNRREGLAVWPGGKS